MKHQFFFQSILLLTLLFGTGKTFAQTPDQVVLSPLGSTISWTPTGPMSRSEKGFAELANGNFVLADCISDASGFGLINVAVYDVAGTQLATYTYNTNVGGPSGVNRLYPQVVALKDGSFVVAFVEQTYISGVSGATLKYQKFTAAGVPTGSLQSIAQTVPSGQTSSGYYIEPVKLLALDTGGFAMLWTDSPSSGGQYQGVLKVQQFDASLTAVSPVSTFTGFHQSPYLVKNATGGYRLSYIAYVQGDPKPYIIQTQNFDASGNLLGTLQTIPTNMTFGGFTSYNTTANYDFESDIAPLKNGGYVIDWVDFDPTIGYIIKWQRFDESGTPIGSATSFSPSMTGGGDVFAHPRVAALSNGGFVVGYLEDNALVSPRTYTATIKKYDASGTLANSTTLPDMTTTIDILGLPSGGIVVGGIHMTSGTWQGVDFYQLDANLNTVQLNHLGGTADLVGFYMDNILYPYGAGYTAYWARSAFNYQRYAFASCITPPTLSASSIANSCPTTTVNLNSLVTSTAPNGSTLKWFNNTSASGTAVTTPTAVSTAGTYYAFYYNAMDNCYTPASTGVIVTITACTTPLTASTPSAKTATTGQAKTGNAATELVPTGGVSPYTYSNGAGDAACVAPGGATALTGLTVNSDGTYSYTAPATAGTYYYCIKVCDSATPTASCVVKTYILTVTVAPCNAGTVAPVLIKN